MIILICAQILFHNLSKLISSAVSLNKVIVLLLEKFIFQMELAVSALPRQGTSILLGPEIVWVTNPRSACCPHSVPAAIWGN